MKLSVTLFFTLLSFSALQAFAQADTLKFQEKEKGFITKDGCKILVKQYYGLSESNYYFRLDDNKTFYYIDTNDVASIHNIRIGKNHQLTSEKHPRLKRGLWVGTCLVFGPIGVLGVSAVGAFILDEYEFPVYVHFHFGFFALLPANTYVFYIVTKDAFRRLKLVKAFETGKPYVCQ
ncbi:MAG: hypothetical protein RLZZ357_1613 [Bacteroidota bacterium]|jgi:hypothetical protein